MAPRLSVQTSIFGVVFFVSKSLLGIERQKKLEKFVINGYKTRITLEQNQNVIVSLHCQGATNTLTSKSINFYQAITYVG